MIGQLSDIDVRLLRMFVAVVAAGGFAPATAALNISESTISNHMKELEDRIGARLCERGRAGFRLTERGEAIYQLTRELLAQLSVYRDNLAAIVTEIGGTITIGLTDGISSLPGEPISRAFEQFAARPDNRARLAILAGTPREIERALIEGSCQLAIIPRHRDVSGIVSTTIFTESNLLFCASGHPWFEASDADCAISNVAGLRCIGRGYFERFDEALLGPITHSATVMSVEAATQLILSGAYVGFLPDHAAAPWRDAGRLRAIRPDELRFTVDICLATAKGRPLAGAAALLASDLSAAFSA